MRPNITKDEKEFIGKLYHDYYPFWYKTANELVNNNHIAQDMVNESFSKLIPRCSNLMTFDKNALLTYVVTTIVNTCKTYLVKVNKVSMVEMDDEIIDSISDDISIEDEYIKETDAETLRNIISRLNDKEKAFLAMFYYEELNDKEISNNLNIPYNHVRVYRARLIAKIRKIYFKESEASKIGK